MANRGVLNSVYIETSFVSTKGNLISQEVTPCPATLNPPGLWPS